MCDGSCVICADHRALFVKHTMQWMHWPFLLQNLTHATDTHAMSTPNATIVMGMQSAPAMMGMWGTENIAKVSFFIRIIFIFFHLKSLWYIYQLSKIFSDCAFLQDFLKNESIYLRSGILWKVLSYGYNGVQWRPTQRHWLFVCDLLWTVWKISRKLFNCLTELEELSTFWL